MKLAIKSPAFTNGDFIPSKYTCDGLNINPPFDINGIPKEAKSLALIAEDPDAPMGTWVHWVVWNIPLLNQISADTSPGIEGVTSFRKKRYGGPCPPSGIHRYFFIFYALDDRLDLPDGTDKEGLLKAISGHILASGEIMGRYKRS
jgi:Raf kinase inhibitor-like YbhB/YbcL family protein